MSQKWYAGCSSPSGRQILEQHTDGEDYCIATVHAGNGRDYDAIAVKMAAVHEMTERLREREAEIAKLRKDLDAILRFVRRKRAG